MTGMIGGFKGNKIENRTKVEPVTSNYIGRNRTGLETLPQVLYNYRGAIIAGAGSTISVLKATNSSIRKGDKLRIDSDGVLYQEEYFVLADATSTDVTLAQPLPSSPIGLFFSILRPVTQVGDQNGYAYVNINSMPVVDVTIENKGLSLDLLQTVDSSVFTNFPQSVLSGGYGLTAVAYFENRTNGTLLFKADGGNISRRIQPGAMCQIGGDRDLQLWAQSVSNSQGTFEYEGIGPTLGTLDAYSETGS